MSEDSETIVLLFTQFLNGQINGSELNTYLDREREKETQKLVTLQTIITKQGSTIDKYVDLSNKNIIEIRTLKNKLSDMTIDRDKWKEKYDNLPKVEMNLLGAIQILRKGKFEKLNVTNHGSYASWDPDRDEGWKSYTNAKSFMRKYKILEKVLEFLKYI